MNSLHFLVSVQELTIPQVAWIPAVVGLAVMASPAIVTVPALAALGFGAAGPVAG